MGSISSRYVDLLDQVNYNKQWHAKHDPQQQNTPEASTNPPPEPSKKSAEVESAKANPEKCKESSDSKKLKACCACPETKKLRDQCVVENGEENCGPQIEAHKRCMREAGFDI